ncbi:MAG: class A beta-lactamase, subclass A2 [Saprospiraceae bacterium]
MKTYQLLTAVLLFFHMISFAQVDILKGKIEDILKDKKVTVGLSIIANNYKDTLNINGQVHFPMQSVYKFPIALAVLSEIDQKRLALHQEIVITKKDLLPNTWSPIRDQYPNGTTMTIADIIRYTVSQSDNNGCDILIRLIGIPTIEAFLKKYQLDDISINTTEEEMQKEWNVQFQNWATPTALTHLLIKTYQNDGLFSQANFDFIWKVMEETSTGQKRLKEQLPKNTSVAHKTGTSGRNEENLSVATNDIGVIKLPDGDVLFISVLVSNSLENDETNERIISDIAKAVWDYYTL